jgi:hypothetical protein
MSAIDQKLIGLQRAEFNKATLLQERILKVQFAILVISCAAVFVTNAMITYFSGVVALMLAALWCWLTWQYWDSRRQAERARRATLLMGGLGEKLSNAELRELESAFTVTHAEGKQCEDPNFYAARSPPGDSRLAEMLEESAFWSADLMHRSARKSWCAFASYMSIALVLLLASVPFSGPENFQNSIRVFCAILTLLVSSEIIGAAFAYGRAARSLKIMLPRLESIRAAGFPRADLLGILCDYNSTVEGAPMFPPGIYGANQERLNALWKKRKPS